MAGRVARMADATDAAGAWQLGPRLPVVYRWAYAYSVPGAAEDFIAQNAPPEAGGAAPEPHPSRGAVA